MLQHIARLFLSWAPLLFFIGSASAGGLQLQPAVACDLLSDQRLGARGGYRANGDVYQCRSPSRPMTGGGEPNNSLRFLGRGTAQKVSHLILELQVNSLSAVQRAHRQLADRVRILFERAIAQTLPDEIEAAILSAVQGQWSVNGYAVRLERIVLGGPGYTLRLHIE